MYSQINSNFLRSILMYLAGCCLVVILNSGCTSIAHQSENNSDACSDAVSNSVQHPYTTIILEDEKDIWIYDGYHYACPLECKVVCEVNDIIQKSSHCHTDSIMLMINDKVNDYIKTYNIPLPKDMRSNIIALDSLVTHRFCYVPEDYYTPDYPYGNMDNMIANRNNNIWIRYLNWYFIHNASEFADIDWRTEFDMFTALMATVSAFYSDELTGNDGSGAWVLRTQAEWLSSLLFNNMWKEFLLDEYDRCDSQIPEKCWENIFAELNQITFCDEKRHPELVDSLRDKIHQWSEFRANIFNAIGNERIAEIYRSQTAHVLRDIFIHARCHFDDLGLKSPSEEIPYEWDTPDSVLYNIVEVKGQKNSRKRD